MIWVKSMKQILDKLTWKHLRPLECFNCTTLERMERRLRSVEETIRGGNGNYSYAGPHQRSFIRPGRPDMSHVTTTPRGYDKS